MGHPLGPPCRASLPHEPVLLLEHLVSWSLFQLSRLLRLGSGTTVRSETGSMEPTVPQPFLVLLFTEYFSVSSEGCCNSYLCFPAKTNERSCPQSHTQLMLERPHHWHPFDLGEGAGACPVEVWFLVCSWQQAKAIIRILLAAADAINGGVKSPNLPGWPLSRLPLRVPLPSARVPPSAA